MYIYSPAYENKEWTVYKGIVYNMPIWTFEELTRLATTLKFETDELKKNYEIVGGIPRLVFCHVNGIDLIRQKIDTKVLLTDAKKLITWEKDLDASHILLHRWSSNDYLSYEMRFASEYVQSRILELTQRFGSLNAAHFLANSAYFPLLAGVRGQIYEPFAYKKISSGGTFKARCYKSEEESNITFLSCQYIKFHSDNIVAAYYATVDAISGCSVLQMSVKRNREISIDILAELRQNFIKQLQTRDITLYIVVPSDVFSELTIKKYHEWKDQTWIKCYILEVPITEHDSYT